jgi:TetR/AcrR family transcriptional repressor of lmrAB and yxaGH operons
MAARSTRDRLIAAALRLMRAKGYHGVGLTEILEAARAPKGSLYHAFPEGKADLALAAADLASAEMLRAIALAFDPAATWAEGVATLCARLGAGAECAGSPVSGVLADDSAAFRDRAAAIYGKWQRALAYHAIRLGEDEDRAEWQAESLLIALEGAWTLARVRGDAAPLRDLAARLA